MLEEPPKADPITVAECKPVLDVFGNVTGGLRRRGDTGRHRAERQMPQRGVQRSRSAQTHHCQTLTSNSGCSLACTSRMRSSMYLASVAFSNLSVAPRL